MTTSTKVQPSKVLGAYGELFSYDLDVVVSHSTTSATETDSVLSLTLYTYAGESMISANRLGLDLSVTQIAHLHAVLGRFLTKVADGESDFLVNNSGEPYGDFSE